MSTFALTNSDPVAVVDAINYLLSNMGQGGSATGNVDSGNTLTANTTTGRITSGGNVISYLYPWIQIRYADDATGSGITTSPTNKQYYGIYNTIAQTPSSGDLDNPTNYQWQRVTNPGFGTNKFLFYATYGGGQVAWSVGTTAPNSSYVQTVDSQPVDLNFVTATSTLPLATPFAYIQANTAPSIPTGGTYSFANLILTPPSGWTANLPPSSNVVTTYASQAKFQAIPSGADVGPLDGWTAPVALVKIGSNGANGVNGNNGVSTVNYNTFLSSNTAPSTPTGGYYNFATGQGTPPAGGWSNNPVSANGAPIYATTASLRTEDPNANVSIGSAWTAPFQYTGEGGAQGERGPIPMAYVLTPTSPIGADTVTLSGWFGASRDNAVAPIGMGTPPITNDTACFTQQGNTEANVVYTFSGLTNTWTSVQGSVVNGNVFVTGSVNANAMNVNDAYALTMRGGLVTPGVYSGKGFWLTGQSVTGASAGDAYMSGNVYLGNTTTIGANLIVGNNANVGSNLRVGSSAIIGDSLVVGNNASVGGNISIGNNAFIGGNVTIAGLSTGNASTGTTILNINTVNTTQLVDNSVSLYYSDERYTDLVISNPASLQYYIASNQISNVAVQANSTALFMLTMNETLAFNAAAGANTGFELTFFLTLQAAAAGSGTWSDLFTTTGGSGFYLTNAYLNYSTQLQLLNALLPIDIDANLDFRVLWAYGGPNRIYGTGTLPTITSATLGAQVLTLQLYKK